MAFEVTPLALKKKRNIDRFRRWLRYQYLRLVRLDDSPEKIGRGLAFGVIIGIFPTFGLGLIVAVLAAGPLRLNKAAAVLGTMIMNPWTSPFFWLLSYIAGSLMFGYGIDETLSVVDRLRSHGEMWKNIVASRLVLPYIAGNVIITGLFAALSYTGALFAVRTYRAAKKKKRIKRQGLMS